MSAGEEEATEAGRSWADQREREMELEEPIWMAFTALI